MLHHELLFRILPYLHVQVPEKGAEFGHALEAPLIFYSKNGFGIYFSYFPGYFIRFFPEKMKTFFFGLWLHQALSTPGGANRPPGGVSRANLGLISVNPTKDT